MEKNFRLSALGFELEEDCPVCKGNKTVEKLCDFAGNGDHVLISDYRCPNCDGSGKILTCGGLKFMEFFRRHMCAGLGGGFSLRADYYKEINRHRANKVEISDVDCSAEKDE